MIADTSAFDTRREADAYFDGLREGIKLYAWWKDGVEYVGTCGMTLKAALLKVDNEYNKIYPPRHMEKIPFEGGN